MPGDIQEWTWRNRRGGGERKGGLELYWEVSWDPISDDFTPDYTDADSLLERWVRKQTDRIARVSWFVQGPGTFESAPFLRHPDYPDEHDFLTRYTWPTNSRTGERLRWAQLPVVDKLWNAERADKGGFIQQATGWKPGPFQTTLDWPMLLRLSGFEAMTPPPTA